VLPRYTSLTQWAYIPHNKFLLVWSETGIGGLLAFIVFLVAAAHRGWLALRRADESLLPYAAALNAAFVALLVHMNFEPFHGRPQLMLLFLVAGLLYGVAQVADGRRDSGRSPMLASDGGHSTRLSVPTGRHA
jgi:O-antigen ligase